MTLPKKLNFTVGANNLFDVFPDLQVYENSYFGVSNMHPVQMGTTETISSEDWITISKLMENLKHKIGWKTATAICNF